MQPTGSFIAAAGAASFAPSQDPYARHFSQSNARKPIDLGDGWIAVPTWSIQRPDSYVYSDAQVAQAKLLDSHWTPKNTFSNTSPQRQRCPAVWTTNFCFKYVKGMDQPHLILGRWTKEVNIFGTNQKVDVLALAAGGHMERMCNNRNPQYGAWEPGHMSLIHAANAELKEEIGVDKSRVRASQYLGTVDSVLHDGRFQGIDHIWLRWIEDNPTTSTELKNVMTVPIDMLPAIINRQSAYKSPDGKEIFLGLGHDELIRNVMRHPQTAEFLTLVRTYYDSPQLNTWGQQSAAGVSPGWGSSSNLPQSFM